MKIVLHQDWVYLRHGPTSVLSDPNQYSSGRQYLREADYAIDPQGHLVKNRFDGHIVHYKTTFTWRERIRIFCKGKL